MKSSHKYIYKSTSERLVVWAYVGHVVMFGENMPNFYGIAHHQTAAIDSFLHWWVLQTLFIVMIHGSISN